MRKHVNAYIYIVTLMLVLMPVLAASCSGAKDHARLEALLHELDRTIESRSEYAAVKEHRIDSLKNLYHASNEADERFDIIGHLLDEYRDYNTDSALVAVDLRLKLAAATGKPNDMLQARMDLADYLGFTGSYIDALAIVEPMSSDQLPDYLRSYLFHIKRTIYGSLYETTVRPDDKVKYFDLTNAYRDSILNITDENTLIYHMVLCDKLNELGQPAEGLEVLKSYFENNDIGSHEVAISAFTMANSYRLLGDMDRYRENLLTAAISDLRSASKDYLALRDLSMVLYQDGDVERAYTYLKLSMEDARQSNARQRILEINSIFPEINKMYLEKINHQRRALQSVLAVVCLLVVSLVVAIFFLQKQGNRVEQSRRDVEKMNGQLTELNSVLKTYNEQLVEANRSIAENSYLKEEYIARYMSQCLVYIDNLDYYRKSLNKLAMQGNIEELKRQTKSIDFVDKELKAFYNDFDKTFLRLFPTFVEDFNKLLRPDEQIYPKTDGSLNTELRIFALIRLGITDSVAIAKFLRYSVTTIYNYRTRVRNKALENRDQLESRLMEIGQRF